MKLGKLLIALSLATAITGCASIAGDNTRTIKVTSKPSGAGVYVDNQQYGVTPASITLPNDIYGGKTVSVKKRGFEEQSKVVNTKFQPVAALDILFWPSFIIDGATGNIVKVDPASRQLDYNLQRA
jgi:hypothetical protein